jgi:metal-responsive CopG/Arc/MetJ family transcriptional regulator
MKTAISIPDSVFQSAENLAQRLGLSRSELYVQAVNEYINTHRYQSVKKKLNEVYDSIDSEMEEDVSSMQFRSIPRENWE